MGTRCRFAVRSICLGTRISALMIQIRGFKGLSSRCKVPTQWSSLLGSIRPVQIRGVDSASFWGLEWLRVSFYFHERNRTEIGSADDECSHDMIDRFALGVNSLK